MSDIEWTEVTWNPVVGCSRVSAGCVNCYAERFVHRGLAPQHRGLTVMRGGRPGWTGEVRLVESRLAEPLSWKKPKRVFVNSLSDLFHEALAFEDIAAIFGVMAACPQHTFQVLTKRPERAREFFRDFMPKFAMDQRGIACAPCEHESALRAAFSALERRQGEATVRQMLDPAWGRMREAQKTDAYRALWPLPNVWIGVSVEDQTTADERIPHLLACPAAVRFVSYEPALGPVVFARQWLRERPERRSCLARNGRWGTCVGCPDSLGRTYPERETIDVRPEKCPNFGRYDHRLTATEGSALDWVIVGGESGPGARPFDLAWARSAVAQCREAGVSVFFKQGGARPLLDGAELKLKHRKGADLLELPENIRVREFPHAP